ncbi:exonuclease 1 [Nematocida minor]|uniref:exonuclease 1 n=1 Tax=Nematocida minor TaxID=1912983 RepID=UPI0022204CAF|nr:exonuclease 1 [Nematocida minor]KAI5190249.1 exonuclease 1 [Nematocida minor]
MGITGLLPMLKDHINYVEVSDLRGMKMGVDGYSWLYKAITVYAADVYLRPNDPDVVNKYVNFCVRKCKALIAHNIQLYFVFDGEEHPMKKATNQKRRKRKAEAQSKIEACMKRGNMREAKALMSRCLKVDDAMVSNLMRALKEMSIPYMIAPYEADPQLVYLEREGYIDCITTEDSDLIVYGAKKVLFKLNEAQGGEFYNRERILANCPVSVSCLLTQLKEIVSLCGCDYTDGISKVGLITAHKLMMMHKTVDATIEYLSKKQGSVLMSHIDVCTKVICTFNMHVIKDPGTGKRMYLGETKSKGEISAFDDVSFLGIIEPA